MAAGGGVLAVGVIVAVANPAFAHTAAASVTETCVNETSQSTVHFTNNFAIPATLTYAGPVSGSLALAAMVGTTPGTNSVEVVVASPETLTYSVRWDDGVTQGPRSVPLQAITDCRPAVPTTTTTAVAPFAPPTTLTPQPTVPAVTETSLPIPAPTVLADSIVRRPPTAESSPVVGSTLPASGSDPAGAVAVAGGLLIVGGVLATRRRRADRA